MGLEFEKRPGLEMNIHESLQLGDRAPRKRPKVSESNRISPD